MKKFLGLLAVLAVTAVISSSAFAAISSQTYTAVASFKNSGSAAFTFTLKKVSGNAAATSIAWASSTAFNVSTTTKWVRADQYAVVAATVTKAGFNVYMYQTNKQSTSDYVATSSRTNISKNAQGQDVTTHVYNGLVRKGSGGGEYRGYVPVAYSMVPAINTSISYSAATSTTTASRSDRYLVDAADSNASSDFPNGRGSYTKIASLVGPVFGTGDEGDWTGSDVKNNTAYMYFFGGFASIVGGDEYGTDQLHVVQVTE